MALSGRIGNRWVCVKWGSSTRDVRNQMRVMGVAGEKEFTLTLLGRVFEIPDCLKEGRELFCACQKEYNVKRSDAPVASQFKHIMM